MAQFLKMHRVYLQSVVHMGIEFELGLELSYHVWRPERAHPFLLVFNLPRVPILRVAVLVSLGQSVCSRFMANVRQLQILFRFFR